MTITKTALDAAQKAKLSRRRWLRRIVGYGTLFSLGYYTWRIEPHWLELVEKPLTIRHLPETLQGKKLLQLSDLHIGRGVDSDYVRRSLDWANALQPDLVVITGDFMTYRDDQQIDEVGRVISQLRIPSLGCFAILGNHDYGQQWSHAEVANRLIERLTTLGIVVLRNEIANIHGLQLVGVDDFWGPNYEAFKVLPRVKRDQAVLALCHNPDAQDLVEWQGYQGWVLAGHTHGGQCKPPFLPPPLLPLMNRRYTSGTFDLGNNRQLYISRGLGHLTRVRFNCRPEITLFTLETVSERS